MTVTTFRTSAPNAPSSSVNLVDALVDVQTVTVDLATQTAPNSSIMVVKTDASVHAVTVRDTTPTTLATLSAQWDTVLLFCDGATWILAQVPDSAVVADAVAESGGAPIAIAAPDPTAVIDATAKTCLQSIIGVLQTAGYYS